MKKAPLLFWCIVLLLYSAFPGFALAQSSGISVIVDGSRLKFAVPPIIVNVRTLVPLRTIFEHLGAKVDWNAATRTVTAVKENVRIQLTIGKRTAYKNGQKIDLDAPGQIVKNTTMVPLRFVSESMGARVDWDRAARTVYIFTSRHIALDPEAAKTWTIDELTHLPPNFTALGWTDAKQILGPHRIAGQSRDDNTARTAIVMAGVQQPEVVQLAEDASAMALSADGNAVAWSHKDGIFVGAPGTMPRMVYANAKDESPASQLLFSPDGKLLSGWSFEWDTIYKVIDPSEKKSQTLPTQLNGYFLNEAAMWLDSAKILFTTRASVSLDGKQEYGSGYRQDLAVFDLKQATYRKVTSFPDGTFLSPVGFLGGKGLLVGERKQGSAWPGRYWLYDINDWSRTEAGLPGGQAIVSPDGSRAAVITESRRQEGNEINTVVLWDGTTGKAEPFATIAGERLRLIWSPDGSRLLVNRIVNEPVDSANGVYQARSLTHILNHVKK